MAGEFSSSPFVLGPSRVGHALSEANANMQNNREWDYRLQQEGKMDEWRKARLIQDATDLSKYQTGSDVANAIANQQANTILQKYSALSKNLSPTELQAKISQEMGGLVTGLGGLKSELDLSDKQLQALKQQYPDLDYSTLAREYRTDVLSRRLKGESFVNPLEVAPSQIDLSDPEYLSRYATSNKNLMNAIINPPGAENESVLVGKQGDYTKFEGKLDYFKKPSYDRGKFDKEGFYVGKGMPAFELKGSALPSDALPSSNGKPFHVMDKEVYERFAQDGKSNLELIGAARNLFPNYDKFNAQEKEYAKRHVLYKMAESFNQSQLHPTFSTKPPRTTINVSGKGGVDENVRINDIYARMDNLVGDGAINFSELDADMQKVVKDVAKNNISDIEGDEIIVSRGPDKKMGIYWGKDAEKAGQLISYLTPTSVNFKRQPGVKENRAVLKQQKDQPPADDTYTRAELKGAGWTDAQIDQAVKQKKIKLR